MTSISIAHSYPDMPVWKLCASSLVRRWVVSPERSTLTAHLFVRSSTIEYLIAMTAKNCIASAIHALEEMLSRIQESKETILATKSLLLNFQDQSNDKTAPVSRHEDLTENQRDFDTLGEYLKRVLEFCSMFAESLSHSSLLLARPHVEETSIQQSSTEMREIYSDIRSTHVRIHALKYEFSFEIEKTVFDMLGAPSISSSNKANMELRRYQGFLSVLTSVSESVPKLHVERAGSAFSRIFRRLLPQ
jgi:hypothetical protein